MTVAEQENSKHTCTQAVGWTSQGFGLRTRQSTQKVSRPSLHIGVNWLYFPMVRKPGKQTLIRFWALWEWRLPSKSNRMLTKNENLKIRKCIFIGRKKSKQENTYSFVLLYSRLSSSSALPYSSCLHHLSPISPLLSISKLHSDSDKAIKACVQHVHSICVYICVTSADISDFSAVNI